MVSIIASFETGLPVISGKSGRFQSSPPASDHLAGKKASEQKELVPQETEPTQVHPWVREQPTATASALEAGRCQVAVGSADVFPLSSTRAARVVDNSTSRARNQEPATIALPGPTGPPVVHGFSPSGSSARRSMG